MRHNDHESFKTTIMEGFKANDAEMVTKGFEELYAAVAEEVEQKLADVKMDTDKSILAQRGVRQLTSEERAYYEKMTECMKSDAPMQALSGASLAMPETVINAVFEELTTNHPLLSRIDFIPATGAVKWLLNTNETELAQWGALCSEIVKELTAGFKQVDTNLLKLSAFIPVCKATLELGYEWLDSFIRSTLYEALAAGLENGIINGDGNGTPIGMVRDVHPGVSVVGNAYPKKSATAITDFSPATLGAIFGSMATNDAGKARPVTNVCLIVNPADYYTLVKPATTILSGNGQYVTDIFPFPITVIESGAVTSGEAIIGMPSKYFAAAGMENRGKIEYSDHYQFLEDNRVYLIKLYANGLPKDDNAFKLLDISGLTPAYLTVKTITEAGSEAGE